MAEVYVVRIYRNDHRASRQVVGTVQAIATDTRHTFMDMDELWRVLSRQILCSSPDDDGNGHTSNEG